ncbi:hypothetical protein DPMN_109441 [Dreissena polymorpha]|uniref:Uncharacterized protein n=1 Tax=Dreissena polymorpha TaxID=45954 RepID=A0A9D4QMY1_DREPO|nr:hypothetical protein DPMN_109441 [Dreissena polymorpha]
MVKFTVAACSACVSAVVEDEDDFVVCVEWGKNDKVVPVASGLVVVVGVVDDESGEVEVDAVCNKVNAKSFKVDEDSGKIDGFNCNVETDDDVAASVFEVNDVVDIDGIFDVVDFGDDDDTVIGRIIFFSVTISDSVM